MFLIDEPEQHLHPRAQRQLAAWLRDFARKHDAQVLAITHSVAFAQQANALAHVQRSDTDVATLTACSTTELHALSQVAIDLGLDRGELLAATALFFFVEGLSDKYVLEGLFGRELRRAGVTVIPLTGATQVAQIVDSEVLLRFSSARIAVMLDNLSETRIRQLLSDPKALSEAQHGKEVEERALAGLLEACRDRQRTIELVPWESKDIFFALDPDAIRSVLRSRHARTQASGRSTKHREYPGHTQFWDAFDAEASAEEKQRAAWKRFAERRYAIPVKDVGWYGDVATLMRTSGDIPEPLIAVLEHLERMALMS